MRVLNICYERVCVFLVLIIQSKGEEISVVVLDIRFGRDNG